MRHDNVTYRLHLSVLGSGTPRDLVLKVTCGCAYTIDQVSCINEYFDVWSAHDRDPLICDIYGFVFGVIEGVRRSLRRHRLRSNADIETSTGIHSCLAGIGHGRRVLWTASEGMEDEQMNET